LHVQVYNDAGELVGPVEQAKVVKSAEDWRAQLTPRQFGIVREKGTERAGTSPLLHNKEHGVYACVACRLPLFLSDTKFESGTGWPSFYQPIAEGNVLNIEDRSYGTVRTEIVCVRCDGHLGHVFDDGPKPTGLRYCLNGESLTFVKADALATLAEPTMSTTQPSE